MSHQVVLRGKEQMEAEVRNESSTRPFAHELGRVTFGTEVQESLRLRTFLILSQSDCRRYLAGPERFQQC